MPLATQKRGQVVRPDAKRTRADSLAVVARTVEETEDLRRQELGNGGGHASEPGHEEMSRRLAERLEGIASALSGISPRVVVVQPAK